ncbi:MAG: hypothetical protein WC741_02820 [Patescibacteria group bacterium]|jgi:hypothetical protein
MEKKILPKVVKRISEQLKGRTAKLLVPSILGLSRMPKDIVVTIPDSFFWGFIGLGLGGSFGYLNGNSTSHPQREILIGAGIEAAIGLTGIAVLSLLNAPSEITAALPAAFLSSAVGQIAGLLNRPRQN